MNPANDIPVQTVIVMTSLRRSWPNWSREPIAVFLTADEANLWRAKQPNPERLKWLELAVGGPGVPRSFG